MGENTYSAGSPGGASGLIRLEGTRYMINSIRKSAVGAAIVAAFGISSMAHAAATETATAEVEILSALTLAVQNGSTLDFGQIAVNGAGTATLNPATDAVTCSANLVCVGTPSAVDFDVTGTADASVGITLPSSSVSLGNGTDTITLQNFTSDVASVTLTAGSASFAVGGQLAIAAGISSGVYTGQFDVTVEYN